MKSGPCQSESPCRIFLVNPRNRLRTGMSPRGCARSFRPASDWGTARSIGCLRACSEWTAAGNRGTFPMSITRTGEWYLYHWDFSNGRSWSSCIFCMAGKIVVCVNLLTGKVIKTEISKLWYVNGIFNACSDWHAYRIFMQVKKGALSRGAYL